MPKSSITNELPKCRQDLSFTALDSEGRMINWNVRHSMTDNWQDTVPQGNALFLEVAKLAQHSEAEAYHAMRLAVSDPRWSGEWGEEYGFMESLAKAAIIGLRALRDGSPSYDPDVLDDWQRSMKKEQRNARRRKQRRLDRGINVIPFPTPKIGRKAKNDA